MIGATDSDLERSVGLLDGVHTVRVEVGDSGVQVFIVAEEGSVHSDEWLLSRVRTVVRAERGLDLPSDRVHIARVRPARTDRSRLIFRSVHLYREGQRAEAQVELLDGERNRIGRAEGVAVRGGIVRLVALATLDALRPAFGELVAIELAGVQKKRIGSRPFVLCHLVLVSGREERHLSGSVLVTSDPLEATVFSVLDALNRVFPEQALEEEVEYVVDDVLPFRPDGTRR